MNFKSCGNTIALSLVIGAAAASGLWNPVNAQDPNAAGQEQSKPQPKEGKTQAETVTISGMVTGGEKNLLTVTDDSKAEHKIMVTTDTKVSKAGKGAAVADLKPNDRVTVQATRGSDGALTAVTIDISGE